MRYRGTACPPGQRICAFCGSIRNVELGHLDGYEENSHPSNLVWNCRSCNTKLGVIFKRLGLGWRMRQSNPDARTLAEYVQAVTQHRRGGRIIHETAKEKRREFAAEIWRRRNQRGTDGWSQVPF